MSAEHIPRSRLIVRAEPALSRPQERDWDLMFLLGDAGDYGTPFRAVLDEIVAILARSKPTHLHLPPYEDHEDFVAGQLRFGDARLKVYYEHSLGFLALIGESLPLLTEIKALTRLDMLVQAGGR